MKGFSLIELIVAISVLAMAILALTFPLKTTLYKSNTPSHITTAMELAQERMELILGQKHLQRFANFADPCGGGSPPSICTPPTGYIISSTLSPNWLGNTDYKVINVTVSGNGHASLSTLVARYG